MRMMRRSVGGVRKQGGRWYGLWYEGGKKKSKVLGSCGDMSKGEAREAVALLVAERKQSSDKRSFGRFVETIYFPFFSRKWKHSTRGKNVNRVTVHLVRAFAGRTFGEFKRDSLQDFLDEKAKTLSYSVVNHLRWDLKQIFDLAVAEGILPRNPALMLFTPKSAATRTRRVMTAAEVKTLIERLDQREAVIAKLALLAGMRPGEIFALRWGRIGEASAEVTERVYEGVLDSPKTDHSVRRVALPERLALDLGGWRRCCRDTRDDSFVFASERGTPLSKHNVWLRNMQPKLKGLEWCTFQVMRRTFASLSKANGGDAKTIADQCGHDVGVSLRVYVQTPMLGKLALVNELEKLIQ
jgi:integrase